MFRVPPAGLLGSGRGGTNSAASDSCHQDTQGHRQYEGQEKRAVGFHEGMSRT